MKVFLDHHETFRYRDEKQLSFQHPLSRRMTNLQKAGLETIHRTRSKFKNFDQALRDEKSEFYSSSTYGELKSTQKISEQIHSLDFPISPLAFQHSVNNALAGYFSITNKIHKNITTFGSGYLALDKAIYWLFHRLNQMQLSVGFLIHADEYLFKNEPFKAQVDFLIFSNLDDSPFGHQWELNSIKIKAHKVAYDQSHAKICEFCNFSLPNSKTWQRKISNATKESIESHWVRL